MVFTHIVMVSGVNGILTLKKKNKTSGKEDKVQNKEELDQVGTNQRKGATQVQGKVHIIAAACNGLGHSLPKKDGGSRRKLKS